MDELDINRLFMRAAGSAGDQPEDVEKVFSILVATTLKFRDRVKEEEGIVLTVGDVRATLDWLLESMRTGRLPETDNRVRLSLLKIWLDELRVFM